MNEARLREYLKGRFHNYRDDLAADDDLSGVVDSLGLFELVDFVEKEFAVKIAMQDFRPARFSTIATILAFVDELRTPR